MSAQWEAMAELRKMHRSGTADLSTALAFSRAASRRDWVASLDLARGLDPEHDDLLGLVIWLAQIAGHALNSPNATADDILDGLAQAEREHA